MALTYSYSSFTDSYSIVQTSCIDGALVIPSTYDNGVNGTKPVTNIGLYAFYNCGSITTVTIPNSVTSIGINAFNNCSSLTSVTIPNSITSIAPNTFYACSSLTTITIPNTVTSLGTFAFYGCVSLTSITIPNRVNSIGLAAFAYCFSLTSVKFLGNAPTLGTNVFDDTNVNLKIYRWKNFVTGWSSTFGGKPVVLISDNVVKSGGSGKLTTKKRN
jgi:hypothetical protein